MQTVGAIPVEGGWNSFTGVCSGEADFMVQLLSNCSLPTYVPTSSNFAFSSTFWPDHELDQVNENAMYSSGETNTNMNSFSQGSSCCGGNSIFFSSSNDESCLPCGSDQILSVDRSLLTMNYGMMNNSYCLPSHTSDVMGGDNILKHDASNESMEPDNKLTEYFLQGKKSQLRTSVPTLFREDKACYPSDVSKKRSGIPGELQKAKKRMKSKNGANVDDNDGDNNTNSVLSIPSSSGGCSEDDSYAAHEMASSSSSKGVEVLSLTAKTRAIRGSATDPQSLYARKRRERINERLRILQNLVPNGTKVDISTMLEEAVQYVKFLQLQIKLLSSDDLWMYAPIAYNGMDMGLDLNLCTPKSQS